MNAYYDGVRWVLYFVTSAEEFMVSVCLSFRLSGYQLAAGFLKELLDGFQ